MTSSAELRRRKKVAIAAIIAVLGIGGAIVLLRQPPSSSSASSSGIVEKKKSVTTFAADAWPAGATATYRIAWKSDADVKIDLASMKREEQSAGAAQAASEKGPGDRSLKTHLDIDGELTLRSHGARDGDGAIVLGAVLSKVNVARAEVLGQSPTNELEAELRAGEVVAIVESDGHIRELGFSPTTTPAARSALRALLLEYTAEVGAANGRAVVDTSLGKARIEKDSKTGKAKRVGYAELDALPEGFDPNSEKVVSSPPSSSEETVVASNEEVSVNGARGLVSQFHAKTSLSATLIRTAKEPSAPIPSYVPAPVRPSAEPPSSAEEDEKDHRASLERRSMGVTEASVLADVRVAAASQRQGFTEWIWRDSAYLELHPEQTSVLLDRVMNKEPPSIHLRAAAIDIVVISGTEAAQRALAHSFDTTKTKMSTEDRETLFQHLGQLLHPSLDFIRWAEAEHDKSRGSELWLATSYTLGGLAWHGSEDHPEAANRLVEKLEANLRLADQQQDDRLRVVAIRALGNAGAARSLSLVASHSKSKTMEVRAAVASSLRRMDGEASVDTLLTLVADSEGFVATEAVTSLYRKELAIDDWQALAKAIDEERVPEVAHALLLDGALLRRNDNPECAVLLTSMLASPKVAYKLKERIAAAQERAVSSSSATN